MQVAVNYYQLLGDTKAIVNARFRILDETQDAKRLFDELNDTLSASWDLMFNYARQYYERTEIFFRYRPIKRLKVIRWAMAEHAADGEKRRCLQQTDLERIESWIPSEWCGIAAMTMSGTGDTRRC